MNPQELSTLESLVDTYGLSTVVDGLATVCSNKGDDLVTNKQELRSANQWAMAARKLQLCAVQLVAALNIACTAMPQLDATEEPTTCLTDTECQLQFGGDGSPAPQWEWNWRTVSAVVIGVVATGYLYAERERRGASQHDDPHRATPTVGCAPGCAR